jgi:hypothetical protein
MGVGEPPNSARTIWRPLYSDPLRRYWRTRPLMLLTTPGQRDTTAGCTRHDAAAFDHASGTQQGLMIPGTSAEEPRHGKGSLRMRSKLV